MGGTGRPWQTHTSVSVRNYWGKGGRSFHLSLTLRRAKARAFGELLGEDGHVDCLQGTGAGFRSLGVLPKKQLHIPKLGSR